MSTPMVEVRGVHKWFGTLEVLRGVDLPSYLPTAALNRTEGSLARPAA